jgi:hypothetical protein
MRMFSGEEKQTAPFRGFRTPHTAEASTGASGLIALEAVHTPRISAAAMMALETSDTGPATPARAMGRMKVPIPRRAISTMIADSGRLMRRGDSVSWMFTNSGRLMYSSAEPRTMVPISTRYLTCRRSMQEVQPGLLECTATRAAPLTATIFGATSVPSSSRT